MDLSPLRLLLCLCLAPVALSSDNHLGHHHRRRPDTSPDIDLVPAVRIRRPDTSTSGSHHHSMHEHHHGHHGPATEEPNYDDYDYEIPYWTDPPVHEHATKRHGAEHGSTLTTGIAADEGLETERYQSSGAKNWISGYVTALTAVVSIAIFL